MADTIRHPDGRLEHPAVRHERTDVNHRWILGGLFVSLGFAVLVLYVVWAFFTSYNNYQSAIKQSSFPLAPRPSTTLPQEPRLEQINRLARMESPNVYLRERLQEESLHSYGATPHDGFVHIPIDRAMTWLENRLPARLEPPNSLSKANGLIDAGESNSGRLLRGKPRWSER
jgi:hypothetical protein